MTATADPLDALPDPVAAAAFRRLVRHLRHRHDAENIDLMGLAGFCRNCLADWIRDAGYDGDKGAARELDPRHADGRVEGQASGRSDARADGENGSEPRQKSGHLTRLWIAAFTPSGAAAIATATDSQPIAGAFKWPRPPTTACAS